MRRDQGCDHQTYCQMLARTEKLDLQISRGYCNSMLFLLGFSFLHSVLHVFGENFNNFTYSIACQDTNRTRQTK